MWEALTARAGWDWASGRALRLTSWTRSGFRFRDVRTLPGPGRTEPTLSRPGFRVWTTLQAESQVGEDREFLRFDGDESLRLTSGCTLATSVPMSCLWSRNGQPLIVLVVDLLREC